MSRGATAPCATRTVHAQRPLVHQAFESAISNKSRCLHEYFFTTKPIFPKVVGCRCTCFPPSISISCRVWVHMLTAQFAYEKHHAVRNRAAHRSAALPCRLDRDNVRSVCRDKFNPYYFPGDWIHFLIQPFGISIKGRMIINNLRGKQTSGWPAFDSRTCLA